MARNCPNYGVRTGGIALPALIALPAVLMAFVIGLSARVYRDIHTRMQVEADAASLAGVDAILGDAMLRGKYQTGGNSTELFTLLTDSASVIKDYAQANPVFGDYSKPVWDPDDQSKGDIIFGHYEGYNSFVPVPPKDSMGAYATNLHTVNAVRVYMRRNEAQNNQVPIPTMPLIGDGKADASAVSTAMIDTDVYGFRPLFTDRPIPLVPVALDYATVSGSVTDALAFNSGSQSFAAGNDQIPEITVTLTDGSAASTAAILNIGYTDDADIASQIAAGVLPAQLAGAPFNGAFLLEKPAPMSMSTQLTLAVPGQANFVPSEGSTFATALSAIAVAPIKPRLWPIYDGFSGSQPIIVGFIAARLISATPTTDSMTGYVQSIELKLQPTLVSEPSAATDISYRGYVGVPNLTIAKLRLVP